MKTDRDWGKGVMLPISRVSAAFIFFEGSISDFMSKDLSIEPLHSSTGHASEPTALHLYTALQSLGRVFHMQSLHLCSYGQ